MGSPTVPILLRTHFEVFQQDTIIPQDFINQDADSFLFEVYNRFSCSKICSNLKLRNEIGGALEI